MNTPLDDITVVSVEQAIAAPLASRHLADWGARVIKIERPEVGDFARNYDQAMDGLSSQFVWVNRSKESLALDIKTDSGQQTLGMLLAGADVFIQNLAPGAAARLGLDAKTLVERFPRLIACDISGYGSGGPYSDKKAYDLLVQCETGFLSINGTPDTPSKAGIAIADIATGMYALNGILMGLYRRARTGQGMAFEVSLFDALTEWMSYPAYYTRGSGMPLQRSGARHATIAPYGPFVTGDGKRVFFGIQNEREWRSFCAVTLDDAALAAEPRYASNPARLANRAALEQQIEQRFAAWDSDTVLARLDRAGIANGKMNDVQGLLEHPQLLARQRSRSVDTERGPQQMFLPPITIPGVEPVMGPVPAVGQHSAAILAELQQPAALPPARLPRRTRTYLAVPGHRFKMLQSAAASSADAVFIDLEDAVPVEQKGAALQLAVQALHELDWGDKTVAVRVNLTAAGLAVDEVRTLVSEAPRLDAILVPKVESRALIEQVEALLLARPAGFRRLEIEALIETARGLLHLETIAAAGGALSALHFGVGDFSASLGARNVEIGGSHPGYAVTRKDEIGNYASATLDLWAYPMMRILVAARAYGLRAIDGPCGAFRDAVLTRAWALKAAAMGYDGKQVIHPDQIAPTAAAFAPTAAELHDARRTIEALAAAEAQGLAAVSLDGKLIDYANVRMAQRILAMAEPR